LEREEALRASPASPRGATPAPYAGRDLEPPGTSALAKRSGAPCRAKRGPLLDASPAPCPTQSGPLKGIAPMRPISLVMDADGVFVDFVGGVLDALEEMSGERMAPEELPDWQIFDRIEARFPGQKKALRDRVVVPGFCESLRPTPGAEEALSRLRAMEEKGKIELLIATSPWDTSPTWMYERTKWFEKRGLHRHQIIHTAVKHPIRADVFVDDKPEHIAAWQKANGGGAYLWDTPHNQEGSTQVRDSKDRTLDLSYDVRHPRLRSWDDFFSLLKATTGVVG